MATWRRWVVHLVAVALFATGLTLVLQRQGVIGGRDEAELPPMAPMPFPTSLSVASPPTTRVGSTVQLTAVGYSDAGTQEVALYDGARRIVTAPGGSRTGRTVLALPATSVGDHLLHVEVTDGDGEVARSAPVVVQVAPAAGDDPVAVAVPVEPGETVSGAARRLGVPADALVVDAPGREVPRGRDVIPRGARAVAVVDPRAGLSDLAGDRAVVDRLPPVPAGGLPLTATSEGCGVSLAAGSPDGDVTFFRTSATVPGWVQVVRPSSTPTRTLADLSPGVHVFYAEDDEQVSAQVSVTVPASCARRFGWTGEASIVDGVLRLPPGVTGAYLHLAVDGRPWLRAPARADEYLPLHSGSQVGAHLPALDGRRLDLEVWATKPGSDIPPLTPVAVGRLDVPEDRTLASVVGEPGALDLTVATDQGPAGYVDLGTDHRSLDLTWSSASSRTTAVRWQVLSQPVPSSDRDLAPPGLLATGVSTSDGTGQPVLGGGRSGSFTLDTSQLPVDGPKDAAGAPAGPARTEVLRPPVSAGTAGALTSTTFGRGVPVTDVGDELADVLPLPRQGDPVYVRVLALNEGGAVAAASPPVTVALPVFESAATTLSFTIDSLTIDAGRAPYAPAVGCLVVDVPWTKAPAQPKTSDAGYGNAFSAYVAGAFYPSDGVYCPGAFPSEGCDFLCDVAEFITDAAGAVVGFVLEAASLVAYAYNGVIDAVVDAVAKYNPLCVGLGAASADAGDGCSAVVAVATRAAVTAAAASVGLPPSLPTGEALKALASGELAVLAVELMKQAGVPCDTVKAPDGFGDALGTAGDALGSSSTASAGAVASDPCLAVATVLVGAVREQVEATAEQSIAAASGLPAFPDVKGFTMRPDPRAELQPMRLTVEASLDKATADGTGAVCRLTTFDPGTTYRPSSFPPYERRSFELEEGAPVDGKGVWRGSVALPPKAGLADVVQLLQPRQVQVGVARQGPVCRMADRTGQASTRPPVADLSKLEVKGPEKVTLP